MAAPFLPPPHLFFLPFKRKKESIAITKATRGAKDVRNKSQKEETKIKRQKASKQQCKAPGGTLVRRYTNGRRHILPAQKPRSLKQQGKTKEEKAREKPNMEEQTRGKKKRKKKKGNESRKRLGSAKWRYKAFQSRLPPGTSVRARAPEANGTQHHRLHSSTTH